MSRSLLLDIIRSIRHSKSRFISMIIIIALGTCMFVGMKTTGPSMNATAEEYFKTNNLMDLRVQSTVGLTDSDISAIRNISGVSGVMGEKFVDALVLVNGKPELDIDGSQISTRAYGINLNTLQTYFYGEDNENFINRPTLLEGAFPTQYNQCLVDASSLSTPDSYKIGSTITLENGANTDLSKMAVTQFEIVGIIESPYYLSFERGNSLVGSGKIGTYIYVPDSAFTMDYYSEVYVTLAESDSYDPYSAEYKDYASGVAEKISSISDSCMKSRVDELRSTLPGEIKSAETEYNSKKATVEKQLADAEAQIAQFQKYVDDPDGSYNEAVNKAANALGIAENEFNGNTNAYYSAVATYNSDLATYQQKKSIQAEKVKELNAANVALQTAQNYVNTATSAITTTKQLVTSTTNVITTANGILTSLQNWQEGNQDSNQLTQILNNLYSINPDLYNAISSYSAVSMAAEAIALVNPYLNEQKVLLATYENKLTEQQATLDGYNEQLATAKAKYAIAEKARDDSDVALNAAYIQLNSFYEQLTGKKTELSSAEIELMLAQNSTENDLQLLKATIANAQTYLDKAKTEYNTQKAAAETQLTSALNNINSAKDTLKKLDNAKWNVYDRGDTPGYQSYESAVSNIDVLSNIFPIIFFFVAALVCLTTMSRMVEEERTQIGILKALGYSGSTISSKYLLYAIFASIIGASLGTVLGIFSLPYAISKAYSIMFSMPSLKLSLPVNYIIIGMLIALITTTLAAFIGTMRELREKSAMLMRPKAPKPGKRVLLEKIGFIWKHLNFSSKVTTRNLFRRKGRLFMTVIGIGFCTALVLASIGLYTSINNIMKKQFEGDRISNYDVQVVFGENQTNDSTLTGILKSDKRITGFMLSSMKSVTGGADSADKTEDVYLFVPSSSNDLSKFIKLRNRASGESLTLDDRGAIVTEKFAKDMNVSIGDKVWVDMSDGEKIYIPVSGITENYAFNYIYLTENLYQYLTQTPVEYNYAIGTVSGDILSDTVAVNNTATKKSQLATDFMAYDGINAVAFVSDTIDTLNEVINVLSIIILIFIIAAALLAFIVLYNLSNINISERQRELATLKVLGFRENEMSSYIFRENIFMTVFGIVIGLILGIFVHKVLITYCSVDTVMFVQNLNWIGFVIAAVATAAFSLIVNHIMKRKMRKINMVESLKAVE